MPWPLHKHLPPVKPDLNGSCLFAAGSPTDTIGSRNFQTFPTCQIAFLVAERPMPALLHRLSASVCRRYRLWPHWQWNRHGLHRPKPQNTSSLQLMRWANYNNNLLNLHSYLAETEHNTFDLKVQCLDHFTNMFQLLNLHIC